MEIKKLGIGLLCGAAFIISACGGASPAPAANVEPEAPTEEAMAEKAPTEEAMIAKAATEEVMTDKAPTDKAMLAEKATDEVMADKAATEEAMIEKAATEEAVMAEKATEEAMMAENATEEDMAEKPAEEVVATPAWFDAELTNVNSGETFKINDFKGKVVLVETMAVWCPLCQQQQRHIQTLHQLVQADNLVSLSLDIDPNEDAEILQAHTGNNGFDWRYAVAPPEVAREIGQLYGAQFLNPPATLMFIIDRTGQVHPLPFGVKDAQTLQETLAPLLNEG